MQNAILSIVLLYWPQILVAVAVCIMLLIYGSYIEPKLVSKGLVKERFNEMSREEAAEFIDRFISGTTGSWEIDEFLSGRYRDPLIQELVEYIDKVLSGEPLTQTQLSELQDFRIRLTTPEN